MRKKGQETLGDKPNVDIVIFVASGLGRREEKGIELKRCD